MHINYVTNAQLCEIIRTNLYKIPHDIDGIICVPRGGLFVGTIMAEFLHKPIYTVESFLEGKPLGNGKCESGIKPTHNGNYIVVDDSVSSGESFRKVHEILDIPGYTFIYVAVVGAEQTMPYTDIVMQVIPEFRLFELNFFRSSWVCHCIFDIDGLLCEDPRPGLDMDEPAYIEHIQTTARPLLPLQFPVKALCTHRLIKYAGPTHLWLASHNIHYEKLFMLSFNSMEEKLQKINSPEFLNMKTSVYNMYPDALMFVESNWDEAQRIYKNLHRPVLCTDKNILLQD